MKTIKNVFTLLSSMKTGLIILVGIGVISAIGSGFLPETFFHGTIFKIFLIGLLLNMALCTVNQTRKYAKIHNKKDSIVNISSFRQIGILSLHAGVVLILIGGTMNVVGGQSLPVSIVQGEALNLSEVLKNAGSWQLKLNEFEIEFNNDGSPSQYYSYISLIEKDDVTQEYSISVNNPLKYEGIKAYQHSYGYLINIKGESGTGWQEQKDLHEGELFAIEGTGKIVRLYRYIPNFHPEYGMNSISLRPDNPRAVYSIYDDGALTKVAIAAFGERIEIDPGVFITFTGLKPYTVLTLKTDPGLLAASAGGLMLMLGTCLALFLKPKKQGGL